MRIILVMLWAENSDCKLQDFPERLCQLIITARKRSLVQGNVFTPVCDSVHRGGVCPIACSDTPPWADTPRQTPPWQTPPSADAPSADISPMQTPPPKADTLTLLPQDGHCSGRYASYWNAFLFGKISLKAS